MNARSDEEMQQHENNNNNIIVISTSPNSPDEHDETVDQTVTKKKIQTFNTSKQPCPQTNQQIDRQQRLEYPHRLVRQTLK